ncbi:hypothetical protein GCM10009504_40420 [Pseudomonas laurentiana]|uniref:Uncharacterized protein n=1 Tax=Pseudomonas laurentiana TaxID=2364649 RepID=A0A6I5RLK4_9PSED|nr:hypothetical protein [Pseudomonas laurentiana]NES08952.1 hypothetical protein [Pseudomonas laurentiana]GGU79439.1 hypothetical protein GCM10009504_40420 [Pseudomonas laurentiana]
MSQQAQIDALEHLVFTLIKKNRSSLTTAELFADAKSSVMGEKNSSGTEHKAASHTYLEHLETIWKI